MNRRSSLAAIMSAWNGEELQIKVQGLRTVVRSPQQKKQTQNIHNYRTVQDRNQKNYHPIASNYQPMKENLQGGSKFYNEQFTVRARSKSPNERVSLADLGELYSQNQSRIKSNKSNIKRKEEYWNENECRIQPNRSPKNIGRGQDENFSKVKRRALEEWRNESERQNGGWTGYERNRENEMKEIMESINEIKLPQSENFCPIYNQANIKFEQMKSEILHKILTSGEENEMEDILKEIKIAADKIIAKHSPAVRPQPQLKSHFSFKDNVVEQKEVKNLNEITEEEEDKSLYINLPQFKDDAGSISSIMSKDDIRKDESKEEDVVKIENIFIHDGPDNILGSLTLPGNHNELPIIIQGLKATIKKESSGSNKESAKSSLLPKEIGYLREETKVEIPKVNALHFVRKEEVVKCLVAAHVVERESASIEF